MPKHASWFPPAGLLLALTGCVSMTANGVRDQKEAVRSAEIERLRALTEADMPVMEALHAPEFQVVTPMGSALSRTDYLTRIASGEIDYLAWRPEPMDVRIAGPMAAIRYRTQVDLTVRGRPWPAADYWNTGVYERRGGRWQIVWFQVTEIGSRR